MIKKLFLLLLLPLIAFAQPHRGSGPITRGAINNVQTEDGSVSVFPYSIKFDNGVLTDNGDGTASVDISGLIELGFLNLAASNDPLTGALSINVGGKILTLTGGSITDDSGGISFDDENLTTTGSISINSNSSALDLGVGAVWSITSDGTDLDFVRNSGSGHININTAVGDVFIGDSAWTNRTGMHVSKTPIPVLFLDAQDTNSAGQGPALLLGFGGTANWQFFMDGLKEGFGAFNRVLFKWGYYIDVNNRMIIAAPGDFTDTTPHAQLDVHMNSTDIPGMIVKGITSQTANLAEWQDLDAVVLVKITADGTLSIPFDNHKFTMGDAGATDSYFQFDGSNVDFFSSGAFDLMTSTDTDLVMNFIGTTNSGIFSWLEDEDTFKFSDSVQFNLVARFLGPVVEAAQSLDRIDIGVQNGTPRMVFEDSGSVIWEIDNSSGTFRWFTPGTVRMTLSLTELTLNTLDLILPSDSLLIKLGAAGDASIKYDGTNMVVNPQVVGTGGLRLEGGRLFLQETTTPTAISGYGAIYTKDVNELFFQDGAGVEHLLHGDAFSNLWFHSGDPDVIGITSSAEFVLITSFENIGEEDDLANAVANTTNNDITIGTNGAGKYKITFHTSISSASAASEMIIAIGITLNIPIDVTGASNTTPIIVTSVGHGLLNGDMVTITGATGNTGANGDWVAISKTDDTFTLIDLSGADSAGNGTYDASSGDVTIKFPGNILMHREVGFDALGVGGANADTFLAVSDKIKLYVVNVTSTRDLLIAIVNMEIFRIGD